jgi:hypothetical protein
VVALVKAGDIIALAGLAFMAVGLMLQFGLGLFHLGRHAQRIAALEEKAREAGTVGAAVAVITATIGEMKDQLGEIRHDVKNLLTGRVRPASSRREGE